MRGFPYPLLLLALVTVAIVTPIHAQSESPSTAEQPDPYAAYNGKVRIGFEVELGHQEIAQLFRNGYFDIPYFRKAIQTSRSEHLLTPEIVNGFLDQPGAYEALPESIQSAITQADANLGTPNLSIAQQPIWTPPAKKGMEANPNGRILLPNTSIQTERKIEAPKELKIDPSAPLIQLSDELTRKAAPDAKILDIGSGSGNDWRAMRRRWQELPMETKRSAVLSRLGHLSSQSLAKIVEHLPLGQKESVARFLRVNQNRAPDWLKKSTLTVDGVADDPETGTPKSGWSLEIARSDAKHAWITRPSEYLSIIEQVSRDIGAVSQISNPLLMRRGSVALHEHYSRITPPNRPAVEDPAFNKKLWHYRRLLAVKLLDAGETYENLIMPIPTRTYSPIVGYDHEINHHHSIVNRAGIGSDHHFEVKEHFTSPSEGIRYKLDLLFSRPEEFAERMTRETAEILKRNPSIVSRIAKANPALLDDFMDILDPKTFYDLAKGSFKEAIHSQMAGARFWPPKLNSLFARTGKGSVELLLAAWDAFNESDPTKTARFAGSFYLNIFERCEDLIRHDPGSSIRFLDKVVEDVIKKPELRAQIGMNKLLVMTAKVHPTAQQKLLDLSINELLMEAFPDRQLSALNAMEALASTGSGYPHGIPVEIKDSILKRLQIAVQNALNNGHIQDESVRARALFVATELGLPLPEKSPELLSMLRRLAVHPSLGARHDSYTLAWVLYPEQLGFSPESGFHQAAQFTQMGEYISARKFNYAPYPIGSDLEEGEKALLNFADIHYPSYYLSLEQRVKKQLHDLKTGATASSILMPGDILPKVHSEFGVEQYLNIADRLKDNVIDLAAQRRIDQFYRTHSFQPSEVINSKLNALRERAGHSSRGSGPDARLPGNSPAECAENYARLQTLLKKSHK